MTEEAVEELENLISQISEEAFCSAWQAEIEFYLWDCLTGEQRDLAQVTLSDLQIEALARLSKRIGGWLWFPLKYDVPKRVTYEEWQELFDDWKSDALNLRHMDRESTD